MSGRVRAGAPQAFELHARDKGQKLNSLSVSLTEPQESDTVWTVRVEARLYDRAATRELGRVETVPPVFTGIPSRVVCIASCPGCRGFRVTVEAPAVQQAGAEQPIVNVEMGELPYLHDADGLVAIEPHARLFGERYNLLAATLPAGNTIVPVVAPNRIQTVSAWQTGTGGTLSLSTHPGAIVPLPPNGAAQIAPRGTIRGSLNVLFGTIPAGGGGYSIELTL